MLIRQLVLTEYNKKNIILGNFMIREFPKFKKIPCIWDKKIFYVKVDDFIKKFKKDKSIIVLGLNSITEFIDINYNGYYVNFNINNIDKKQLKNSDYLKIKIP
jgi:hypothetical protein